MAIPIRGLKIGEGRPKIIAPITGSARSEILTQAAAMRGLPVDVAEWRADAYEDVESSSRLLKMLVALRAELGEDMPLLFTCRTRAEGGKGDAGPDAYRRICHTALESGQADILDIELSQGDAVAQDMERAIHGMHAYMLLSEHDFTRTPGEARIMETLSHMEALNADIRKVAYMPKIKKDVRALLHAASQMADANASPICAISMGALGMVSRIACEVYGLALTFGDAVGASAPGQIQVDVLRSLIDLLHVESK